MGLEEAKGNRQFLSGGGEMGERMRNLDWSATPLGNISTWPQSLRTAVSVCLNSRFPILIWWGEDKVKLYNDAYISILGQKHPAALGAKGKDVWPEIWHFIEPMLNGVMENGEATWSEDQILLLNRNSYVEDCYFTFSYSPIYDESSIAGIFTAVTETTKKVLNERQLEVLQQLSNIEPINKTVEDIYLEAARVLESNNKDFPFGIIYKSFNDLPVLKPVAFTGIASDQTIFPREVDTTQPVNGTLNISKAYTTNTIVISENGARWKNIPKGFWDIEPTHFIHLPIRTAGQDQPYAIFSATLNPYRKFDDSYRQFAVLVAEQIALKVNNILVFEEQRKRAEALAEIDKSKTVFFNNISHEFRTPLTLMLGPLEELMHLPEKELSSQHHYSIETTHRNAMRLLKLVNTLLDFSRIESGRQQAHFQLVDIAAYTINLASSFRSVIEKAGLQFTVNAETVVQPVYVDKQMWEKIVFNLLSNAFKYTWTGSITLNLFTEKNKLALQVIDTGIGIPEKELPHMFDRFHRVEGFAGRTYEGTGIGLSMIKELARLNSGDITVESKEGEGSTFTVTIPTGNKHLSEEQLNFKPTMPEHVLSSAYIDEAAILLEDEPELNSQQSANHSPTHKKSVSILVVDDNADMRVYLSKLLEKNYNVLTAVNGMDALNKIKERTPALVLSDIMMPVMDGIELLKQIKQAPETVGIPVILLSARAEQEAKIAGYDIGADDYLIKPFAALELLARVRAQLKIAATRSHAEQQIKNLFLQAPVALAILRGPDMVIEVANEKILQLWGKTAAEVINKPVFEGIPEARGQGYEQLLDSVYNTGKRFITPSMLLRVVRNGKAENLFTKFVYEALYNEDGRITGVMIVADEITEEILARQRTEENEARLNLVIETSDLGTWELNLQTDEVIYSPKYLEIFGYKPGDNPDHPALIKHLHPGDMPLRNKAFEDAKNTGKLFYQARIRGNDRSEHWIEAKGKLLYDSEKKPLKLIGTLRDITREKIHQQQLQDSENKFRTLSNTLEKQVEERTRELVQLNETLIKSEQRYHLMVAEVQDYAILYLNRQGVIENWNTGAEKIKGYTADEIVGKNFSTFYTAQDREDKLPDKLLALALKTGRAAHEGWRMRKDGTLFWAHVVITALHDEDNNVIGFSKVTHDLTEKKNFNDRLKQSALELVQQNKALEKMNKELHSFAYVSSHDLQEPLRKIQTFASHIMEREAGNLSADGMDRFERMRNAAERMRALIDDLLSYSRTTTAERKFEKTELRTLIELVKEDMDEEFKQKHATLQITGSAEMDIIPFQFRQVIQNLFSNSLKFSREGVPPQIDVHLEIMEGPPPGEPDLDHNKKYCHLRLSDNGIGFEPEFNEKIFEVFQRLHGRSSYTGTGIGLAIVKKIAENHNGIITASGTLGEGVVFDIYLPMQ